MQTFVMLFLTLATVISAKDMGSYRISKFPFPDELNKNERIVGGETAKIEDHGHQAALLLRQSPDQNPRLRCGAAVMSDHWAVTAAHCNIPNSARDTGSSLSLRVGSDYHDRGGEHLEVDYMLEHPDYEPMFLWCDIGLVKTKMKITMQGHVKSIQVDKRTPETGEWLEVCGWGLQDQSDLTSISEDLQVVQLQKFDDRGCQDIFWLLDRFSQFCAGGSDEGGYGVCNGDSGSPIYSIKDGKQLAVGLVSGGRGCADPGIPSVFTRLSSFTSWIEDMIGEKVTYEEDSNEIVEDGLLPIISTNTVFIIENL